MDAAFYQRAMFRLLAARAVPHAQRPGRRPVPAGYVLIPGVLHAYKASAADLSGYVRPGQDRPAHQDDDSECDRDDHGDHGDHGTH